MLRRRIRAHYEQLSKRCWQEWVDKGIFQRHNDCGRPRATADRKDRLIIRSAVTAPDSSLSTIRSATRTRVSTITTHRRQIEQNLHSYRPLRPLPLTPTHCRDKLQWCLAVSDWNHADWERIVFSDESRFRVLSIIEDASGDAQGSVPILLSLLHATQVFNQELCLSNTSLDRQFARSLSNRACLGNNGKVTADDLARQLEQIQQEIQQEIIRLLYHSMPRHVAAFIQARGGSTPY
ncbi:HTH_Tnp_Tc3_2 domain-containing protein [Trichonephila clavipes]|nr:HTH_Tnp_Tc3_2 domain-containing protein [Trichonephila clavipes]